MKKANKTMITVKIEIDYCPHADTIKYFIDDIFNKQLHTNESVAILSINHFHKKPKLK